MTDKETLMFVCRDPRDLKLLSRFRELKSENQVVVASDDLLVQGVARVKSWVDKVCFLEGMESYFAIASEVIQILQVVNQWLKSLADEKKGVPGEMLFWIKHAEGGMTTQRIQDLLLLIRSYQHLLREHNVRCLIIARRTGHGWEDGVLVDTARRMGISVEEFCPFFDRIRDKLGITTVWRTVRPALVQLMFYLHILHTRIRTRPRSSSFPKGYPEIMFQLGGSERKHVENIMPLIHEFRRRGKYKPVTLCWQASDGAAQIRREGLQADELEAWFPLSRLLQIMQQARRTWKSARKRKREFYQSSSISYNGIPLGPHLWPSVKYFLQEEIIRQLVLKISAEEYFAEHHPVGMKLWGAGILDFGAICQTIAKRVNEVLTFDWVWGGGVYMPYFEKNCDLYLASGELDRCLFINLGVSSEQIAVAGLARYDHLASFTRDNSPLDSRKLLNLPLEAKFYLFFATSNIVRGSISLREQFILADALIGFFKDHSDCVLVIKPHPGDYSGVTERLTEYSETTNIKTVNRELLPYHCINAVDAVVTKFSIVGIETMLLGKPVISVILDNERRWQEVYGKMADCFYDIQDLINFLDLIILNPEEKERWEYEQQRVRREFLSQKFTKGDKSGAEMMADAIEKRLLIRAQSART